MKKINETRKFVTTLGILIPIQFLCLALLGVSIATLLTVLFIEIFLLLLALWLDARTFSRHTQLIQRIARASTRPEVNQLKWQLEARDKMNFDALLAENSNSTKTQEMLREEVQELATELRTLRSASKFSQTNDQSLYPVQSEVRALRQQVEQLKQLVNEVVVVVDSQGTSDKQFRE